MSSADRSGRSIKQVSLAVALAIAASRLTVAHADEQPALPSALEEITVTATRQAQPLSKVPVSVAVQTAAMLEQKDIRDIGDMARFTPGLTVDTNGTNNIAIRGISSAGGAGTTGIYIDDVPIQMRGIRSDSDNALIKLFDLDRIEVLRGPQGTLFGSGSEGGTVRYISTQPSLSEYSGHAKAETSFTAGGAPSYEAGLAAGGPVVEGTLGVRASAWYRKDGGWIDQVDPLTLKTTATNANHDETTAFRVAMLWQPIGALKISPSVFYQNRQRAAPSIFWPTLSDPDSDRYVIAVAAAHSQPDKFYLPSLNIEADLGVARLISTTSYFHRDDVSGIDGTVHALWIYQTYLNIPAYGIFPFLNAADFPLVDASGVHIPANSANVYQSAGVTQNQQRNFTQELRLQSADQDARLTWTVGGFYADNRQSAYAYSEAPNVDQFFLNLFGTNYADTFNTYLAAGVPTNPDGSTFLADGTKTFTDLLKTREKQLAGFAEGNFKITPALKLTLGVRVGSSKVTFTEQTGGAVTPTSTAGEKSETPVTPKAGLSYQLNDDHFVYATYAKGFRPGGSNAFIPYNSCKDSFDAYGITSAPGSYDADTVQSYEVGAKDNFNNRVRLASSVYYIRWNNIQQNVHASCGADWIANLGNAVSKGFDVQADISLMEGLTLDAAVGYNDARYTKSSFVGPSTIIPPIVSKGDAILGADNLPIAPWSASAGLEYDFNVFARRSFVRADYQFSSAEKWASALRDPNTVQYDSQTLQRSSMRFASMRAGMHFDSWTAAVFVDNLLDSHPILYSTHEGISPYVPVSSLFQNSTYRPRTIGVTATYQF
jgi:outer membrane receptor protein involved in Fe transport